VEKVIWLNGKPENIRDDNSPEFIAQVFKDWCKGNEINIMYIQPGKPTQNGYIERFNGSYRRGLYLIDRYSAIYLKSGELIETWRKDYNEERPYEALDNMTPFESRGELIKRKKQYDRCFDKQS
jgi:putative transposase